jgi:hypothetical protein
MPDKGQGPNIIQGQLDGFDEQRLREAHSFAQPGGGPRRVRDAGAAATDRVRARQVAAGVSPAQTVDGADLETRVAAGQAAASTSIDATSNSANAALGEAQLGLNERAKDVSDYHRPIYSENPFTGEPIRNKALDASREWGRDKPFRDEADRVSQEKEAASKKAFEQMKKMEEGRK